MKKRVAKEIARALKRIRYARNWIVLAALLLLSLIWPHRTHSQQTTAAQAIPQRVVYGQAFKHVVFLDDQADILDQQGGKGNALRKYYQSRAGLTDAETALLKSTAHNTVTAIAAVDQQIQTAVAEYRAQLPHDKWKPGAALPALPAGLQTLQTQKDNLVLNAIAAIQSGYGAARFQNLDAFVQSELAPHITLTTAKPPTPATPGTTLPPLQPVP